MPHRPQRRLPSRRRPLLWPFGTEESPEGFDYVLLMAVAVLLVIGLIEVYSASSHTAAWQHNDPHYFFKSHLFRLLLGGLAMALVMHAPVRLLFKFADAAFVASVVLLVCVLVWGVPIHGSRRWLRIGGVPFEPSEIARLGLVIFLAKRLGSWTLRRLEEDWLRHLLPAFVAASIVAGLIAKEPDLDSVGLIVVIFLLMLVFAGVDHNLVIVTTATAFSAAAVLMVVFGYFQSRIASWLAVWLGLGSGNPGSNNQVSASLAGLANGGLLRLRPGQGVLKYSFLPMAFSDFVFAIVGEEFGLLGTLTVVALFGVVTWRGVRIAVHAPSPESRLLAMGLTASIFLNALLNMLVVTGLAPTSGLPLPFISYGGTAIVVNMVTVGILLAISREAVQGAEGYLNTAGYRERMLRRWPSRRLSSSLRARRVT